MKAPARSHERKQSPVGRVSAPVFPLCFLALALLLHSGANVHALEPAADTVEREVDERFLRERQRREMERSRRDLERGMEPEPRHPEVIPFELPEEEPCFVVDEIALEDEEGGRLSRELRFLHGEVEAFVGHCIGGEGVSLVVNYVTQLILARGYPVGRAALPAQDMTGGRLRIAVIVARLGELRNAPEQRRNFLSVPFPISPGDYLYLPDMEQGLEQLRRVPELGARMEIEPGNRPGYSDMVVTLEERRRINYGLAVNDAGGESSGKYQANLTTTLNNPLAIGDILSLHLGHDINNRPEHHRNYSGGLHYSFPVGYWTIAKSAHYSWNQRRVEGFFEDFEISGEQSGWRVEIDRVIWRAAHTKLSAFVRTGNTRSRSYINDVEIKVQRANKSFLEYGLGGKRDLGRLRLNGELGQRIGVDWFGGQEDAPDRLADEPTAEYRLTKANIGLIWYLSERVHYEAILRGQHSDDPLFTAEYFSIGGRYSVRGFDDEAGLLAPTGWYWRNQLDYRYRAGHSIYIGVDEGQIRETEALPQPGTRLFGAVIGLSGRLPVWGAALRYDIFHGWPVFRPEGFQTQKHATGLSVTVRY